MSIEDVKRNEDLAWGPASEVRDSLIATSAKMGTNTLLISFNRGAMPGDMFME